MDIKSLILIGGGLLLAAVIGHGFWLAWRNKRSNLRLDIDPNIPEDDVDPLELLRGELPNGGARVRTAQEEADAERNRRKQETLFPDPEDNEDGGARAGSAEPALQVHTDDRIGGPRKSSRPSTFRRGRQHDVFTTSQSDAPADEDDSEDTDVQQAEPEAGRLPDEVIVINVLGRGNVVFAGNDLMEVFLRHKLKFGDMNIFHRLEPVRRVPQFSVASAVEPGTFDLSNMDSFSTRGVSLFMQLPGPKEPLATFDDMLAVARDLAGSLGGDLKDEQLSVMTAQSIEHCRQRITDYTRKRLSQRG